MFIGREALLALEALPSPSRYCTIVCLARVKHLGVKMPAKRTFNRDHPLFIKTLRNEGRSAYLKIVIIDALIYPEASFPPMAVNFALISGYVIASILTAIPLYFAVIFLGGKTTIAKTVLVNLLCAVVLAFIRDYLGKSAGIAGFFSVIFVYKVIFEIGWLRAFLLILLEGAFIQVFSVVAGAFGMKYASLGYAFVKP